jgi:spore germination protein GerM
VSRRPPRARRLFTAAAAVMAATAALAACGIPTDSAPRDIALGEQPIDLQPTPSAVAPDDPSTNGARVYFLIEDQGLRLEPTGRQVSAEFEALLEALLQGPTGAEREDGVYSAIPTGTTLLNSSLDFEGTLAVDLSEEFLNQDGAIVGNAVAQVVFTTTEDASVQRVVVTVRGETYPWTLGDKSFAKGATMTRLDFPTLDPTELPGLPQPSATVLSTVPITPSTAEPPGGAA